MRERIKEIIEREGMSQSQFADYIGVNRPTLSHILAGRNNPSIEVMMKIHQRFPKINIVWLFDGIGSYEGDAVADYPTGTLAEDRTDDLSDDELSSPSLYTDAEQAISSAMFGSEASRFYQGESTGAAKNRKEIPLQQPQKAPYLSDNQIEYARKFLQRKIVEIKIFFDDGTYETFKP